MWLLTSQNHNADQLAMTDITLSVKKGQRYTYKIFSQHLWANKLASLREFFNAGMEKTAQRCEIWICVSVLLWLVMISQIVPLPCPPSVSISHGWPHSSAPLASSGASLCNAGGFWFSGLCKKKCRREKEMHRRRLQAMAWAFFSSLVHEAHHSLFSVIGFLHSGWSRVIWWSRHHSEGEMVLSDWERLATTGQVQPTRTGLYVSAHQLRCAHACKLFSIHVNRLTKTRRGEWWFLVTKITYLHLICRGHKVRALL